jgi:hypothetical protein
MASLLLSACFKTTDSSARQQARQLSSILHFHSTTYAMRSWFHAKLLSKVHITIYGGGDGHIPPHMPMQVHTLCQSYPAHGGPHKTVVWSYR